MKNICLGCGAVSPNGVTYCHNCLKVFMPDARGGGATGSTSSFNPVVDNDPVNHPRHYTQHPSGIECIQITRHMGFNLGNAMKYVWRADLKNGVEDLKKAIWYIEDEIKKRGPSK